MEAKCRKKLALVLELQGIELLFLLCGPQKTKECSADFSIKEHKEA